MSTQGPLVLGLRLKGLGPGLDNSSFYLVVVVTQPGRQPDSQDPSNMSQRSRMRLLSINELCVTAARLSSSTAQKGVTSLRPSSSRRSLILLLFSDPSPVLGSNSEWKNQRGRSIRYKPEF